MRKHPLAKCESCPLAMRDYAPTSGPEDATVAFISRSPGYHDIMAKRPFAGPSGRVLDHLLEQNGVSRSAILTTNVVLCQSDEPPLAAIEACRPRLEDEIKDCKTLIVGGVEAVHTLVHPHVTVTNARRRNHNRTSSSGVAQRIVATTNPAVVLRESGNFPDMVRDFRFALNPTPEPTLPKVWFTEDPEEGIEQLRLLMDQPLLASDLETFGYTGGVACAGFAYNADMAYVFGVPCFSHQGFMYWFKTLYQSETEFIWHNGKFDVKRLRQEYDIKARIDHDTFLLSYAVDERPGGDYQGDQGAGLHALTPTLIEAYGWPDYEYESAKHFKKNQNFDYHIKKDTLPENYESLRERARMELYDYNGKDTVGTWVLFPDYKAAAIADDTYDKPYRSLFIPLANALLNVEMRGFNYDIEAASDLNEDYVLPKIRELRADLQTTTGRTLLNPASSQQMKGVYYEQYGLKHNLKDTNKKKKTGSTDKDVRKEILEGRFECKSGVRETLVRVAELHEVFNKINTQRGTFIEGLIKRVQEDGKLYTTFKFGTTSGRLSSADPNFQNITRSGAHGIPSMRDLFIASPGNVIVQADLSQAELRTLAKLSHDLTGETNFISIYRDTSRSLHRERAASFYGADYTKEQYTTSKNMNFGISYLQSAFTFSQMYQIPQSEAQAYIDAWWSDFPELLTWITEDITRQIMDSELGFLVSPFGHKRRFHLITKENRDESIRQGVNFKPQNIAGCLTEMALIELVNAGIPVVSTVHDSILADCPVDEAYEVGALMKQVMERMSIEHLGWTREDIPFITDISIGETWGSVEEVELEVAA